MATYLDAILTAHRARAASDHRSTDALVEAASGLEPARGFAAALRSGAELRVIAEVKRRSPSKGPLAVDLDPAALAGQYLAGGASCLSVLTDVEHFGGSAADLAAARAAVPLPVLRKDFTVCANDVCDARIMGADCVLLIVAALDDAELADFSALAGVLGIDVLVEVHDESELERALVAIDGQDSERTHRASGVVVGVNQRDLVTFSVDQARAVRVAAEMPEGMVRVAESGVRGRGDAVALAAAGYDAVLVGEHLVTSGDPEAAIRALRVPTPG